MNFLFSAILTISIWVGVSICYGLEGSSNFIVLSKDKDQEIQIMNLAEMYRETISQSWFHSTIPEGVGRALINITQSSRARSNFTWKIDSPERRMHTVYLTGPRSDIPSLLHHEMVHVVFDNFFPRVKNGKVQSSKFPIWIEEGIACQYDSKNLKSTRKDSIKWMLRTGNWPLQTRIFINDANSSAGNYSLYACREDAVLYLLELGGKDTLLAFGQDCINLNNTDESFRKHYNIESSEDFFRLLVLKLKRNYS